MRKFVTFFFALTCVFVLVSCSENTENNQADFRVEQGGVIRNLESQLLAENGDLNEELGKQMIAAYVAYADSFPGDSITFYYWYKAGEVAQNIPGKELHAVTYFANIYETQPEHPLSAQALFLTGVAFDKLGDKERAAKSFQYFMDSYPEHAWFADAQAMLSMNQDTTDLDQQVKAWLKKAQE